MRTRNTPIPTVTQAANMEMPGPGRDALFKRAEELFAARGGIARQRAARSLEDTVMRYDAGMAARDLDPDAPLSVGVREGLRAALAIDKAYNAIDRLREECFREAREEIWRTTGRRVAEQVWEFEGTVPPEVQHTNARRTFTQVLDDEIAAAKEELQASKEALAALRASDPNPPAPAKVDSNLLMAMHFQNAMIQPPPMLGNKR